MRSLLHHQEVAFREAYPAFQEEACLEASQEVAFHAEAFQGAYRAEAFQEVAYQEAFREGACLEASQGVVHAEACREAYHAGAFQEACLSFVRKEYNKRQEDFLQQSENVPGGKEPGGIPGGGNGYATQPSVH